MPFTCGGKTRVGIIVLCTLCCTAILANMNTYNFTKICKSKDSKGHVINETISQYTDNQKAMFQSVVAIGSLLSAFPFGVLFEKFSAKRVFLGAGIISTIATALCPIAHTAGFVYFLLARFFQGCGFAATFMMIGFVLPSWAVLTESAICISLLTGCTQLSNIWLMPVAGALCDTNYGWPLVYYLQAIMSAAIYLTFSIFFTDSPADHNFVGDGELQKIRKDKSDHETNPPTPYWQIIKDKAVIVIWIAAFGDLMGVSLAAMSYPTYLDKALHYSVKHTGIMGGLPILFQFFMKIGSSVVSDLWKSKSALFKVRFFNSVSLAVSGVLFIGMGFIPESWNTFRLIYSIINFACLGANSAAFNLCAVLYSRQFSKFVVGQIITVWASTIIIEPFVVTFFNTNNTMGEWRNIFYFHAAILIISNFIFCFWSKTDAAEWTKIPPTSPEPVQESKLKEAQT